MLYEVITGVLYLKNGKPERETGIIEEILLENRFFNPQESYPVWDHIMYDYVTRQNNLDLMLNTQARITSYNVCYTKLLRISPIDLRGG